MNGMPGASEPEGRYACSAYSERHHNPMRVTASLNGALRRDDEEAPAREQGWATHSLTL